MSNLLKETLGKLRMYKKKPKDVLFVQTEKCLGSWDDFSKLADFEYDDGYGGAEVTPSLKIVGRDW